MTVTELMPFVPVATLVVVLLGAVATLTDTETVAKIWGA